MSYIKLNEENDKYEEKMNIIETYYNEFIRDKKVNQSDFLNLKNKFKTENLFNDFDDVIDKNLFTKLILDKEEELVLKLKEYKESYDKLLQKKNILLYKKRNSKLNKINEFGLMKGSNLLIRINSCSMNLVKETVFLKFILDGEVKNSNFLNNEFKNDYTL